MADHYAKSREQFELEVVDHRMTILHRDGLYRHLRFAKPDTRMWSFDLITWPGYLTIVGDIGDGYTFNREPDMIRFFNTDRNINPGYWREKLPRSIRQSVKVYSAAVFEEITDDWFTDDRTDGPDEIYAQRLKEWHEHRDLYDWRDSQEQAGNACADFEASDGYRVDDWWESDFTEFDHHYLLACHAIRAGVEAYLDGRVHLTRGVPNVF